MDRIKAGIRDGGGILEFPLSTDPGNRQAPDRRAGPQPCLSVAGRGAARLSHRRRGADHRLRQDHARHADGAATVDIPAITLNGGPMLDGWWHEGKRTGPGPSSGKKPRLLAAGKIDYDSSWSAPAHRRPSLGHCNTMGTASDERHGRGAWHVADRLLGHSGALPRTHGHGLWTGKRIVQMVLDDLKPSDILSRESFENAIVVNAAIGGSTNAPPHLQTIARHAGIELNVRTGKPSASVPLILNMQPAGEYLGESFFRAGGVPAVMGELMKAGLIRQGAMTVSSKTMAENLKGWDSRDGAVIRTVADPCAKTRAFWSCRGTCSTALMNQRDLKDFATASCPSPAPRASTKAAPSSLKAPRITTTASTTRAWHRRKLHPVHPQCRLRRLPRQRRGGEHAAAGRRC